MTRSTDDVFTMTILPKDLLLAVDPARADRSAVTSSLDRFGELAASIQNLNAAVEAGVARPVPPSGRSWPKRGRHPTSESGRLVTWPRRN
jgi:hypothetical protein